MTDIDSIFICSVVLLTPMYKGQVQAILKYVIITHSTTYLKLIIFITTQNIL